VSFLRLPQLRRAELPLYQRKVAQYGEASAAKIVAPPGTSEHQTGLACDITDKYYEFKDSVLKTPPSTSG
jgi:LAS superfamily LD-carboxypeptidase LdcB